SPYPKIGRRGQVYTIGHTARFSDLAVGADFLLLEVAVTLRPKVAVTLRVTEEASRSVVMPTLGHFCSTTSMTMHEMLSREPWSRASWPRPSAHSCTSALSRTKSSSCSSGTPPVRPSVQSTKRSPACTCTTFTSGPSPTSGEPRYFHSTFL